LKGGVWVKVGREKHEKAMYAEEKYRYPDSSTRNGWVVVLGGSMNRSYSILV
jgi:hypothetical protein